MYHQFALSSIHQFTLFRAKIFSGILPNLSKQNLAIIKLNNLNKIFWQLWLYGTNFFQKGVCNPKQKNEHYHRMPHIWISLSTKFHLK